MQIPKDKENKLRHFLQMLLEMNQCVNLTSVTDADTAWERHILDALAVCPILPTGTLQILDVGTGGGIPGIPLAVLCPQHAFTLLDATGKKIRFLESVVGELPLENTTLCWGRAEEKGRNPDMREQFDVVVSRAVAPLPVLMELCLPFLKTGGRMMAMKGGQAYEEIRASSNAFSSLNASLVAVHDRPPAYTGEGVLIEVRKDAATPEQYPRRAGVPKKRPL